MASPETTEPVDPLEELPAIDVDALLLQVKRLEGDLESWKIAMSILLAELITFEMPFCRLDAAVDKMYSKLQSHIHWGHATGHKGALAMNEPLMDRVARAVTWRQMAREHKEKTGECKW